MAQTICHVCGTALRPGARFCRHCGTPVAQAAQTPTPQPSRVFCSRCGEALSPEERFCFNCGQALNAAPASPAPAYTFPPAHPTPVPKTYAPPPPAPQPPTEPIVGIIPAVERQKGLFKSESFNLLLTPQRLVFARLTSDMLKSAADMAKQAAKAEGKGFFKQWGAMLQANRSLCERYYHMPLEAILREHPDNFALPIQQIQRVRVRSNRYDDESTTHDQLIIKSTAGKLRFNLKGMGGRQAKKTLRQVLGKTVK